MRDTLSVFLTANKLINLGDLLSAQSSTSIRRPESYRALSPLVWWALALWRLRLGS